MKGGSVIFNVIDTIFNLIYKSIKYNTLSDILFDILPNDLVASIRASTLGKLSIEIIPIYDELNLDDDIKVNIDITYGSNVVSYIATITLIQYHTLYKLSRRYIGDKRNYIKSLMDILEYIPNINTIMID